MDEVYNPEACRLRHNNEERRISAVETTLKEESAKQEERLTRIHERFNEVAEQMVKRLPMWVTVAISFLSAVCTGLAVAAIK